MMNKTEFQRMLDKQPFPEEVLKNPKNRIKKTSLYGSWLRRTDPVQFNVLYNEYIRGVAS
jgi:hypothetical protein